MPPGAAIGASLSQQECYCCGREFTPGARWVTLRVNVAVGSVVEVVEYPAHARCARRCLAHPEHRTTEVREP